MLELVGVAIATAVSARGVATVVLDNELVSTSNTAKSMEATEFEVATLVVTLEVCAAFASLTPMPGRSVTRVKVGRLLVLVTLAVLREVVDTVDTSRFMTRASTQRIKKQRKSVASNRFSGIKYISKKSVNRSIRISL